MGIWINSSDASEQMNPTQTDQGAKLKGSRGSVTEAKTEASHPATALTLLIP